MKTFINFFVILFFVALTSCGGGGSSKNQSSEEPTEDPTSDEDFSEDPTSDQDSSNQDSSDQETESESEDGDVSEEDVFAEFENGTRTLSIAVTLEDDGSTSSSVSALSALIKAVSIIDQVSRVYLEVIIDGTVYSTTDLTQDEDDPLTYTGSVTIPVDVEISLHAVAVSEDGTILFEGTAESVTATEYGTPAISLYLQRQVATEDSEVNTAPVIHVVYIGDQSLAYGESTNVSVEAEDPQDDLLTYLWEVTSVPDGIDATTLLTNADQQGATFTAPSVDGLYTVRVTVTDDEGATDTAEIVLYVSETGLDDEPEVEVVLADFPDCVILSTFSSTCASSDEALEVSITNTKPDIKSLSLTSRFETDEGTETYSASQLYSLGMNFQWSDTCAGNNFIETAGDGNQSAAETSNQVAPSFYKTNLTEETCQITLQLTNEDGLSDTYQFVLNYTDTGNNDSDELNCDEDPGSTSPKIALTCPDEMTSVPGVITVEVCDAQGDLQSITGNWSYLWSWYTTSAGVIQYKKLSGWYDSDSIYFSGTEGSATYLFLPYYNYSDDYISSSNLTVIGADGYMHIFTYKEDIVDPIAAQIYAYANDTNGNSASAYCTFPIAEDIDLTIPEDYFTVE